MNHRVIRRKEFPMDQILQLANIAGPFIAEQPGNCVGMKAFRRPAVLACEALQEHFGEEYGVMLPFAQRRKIDGQDVEPEQEVPPKMAVPYQFPKIRVARRYDPYVGVAHHRAAHGTIFEILEETQQRDLRLRGQHFDLVQEQGSSFCFRDQASPGIASVGERSPSMAEQLALHQAIGQRAAVDVDEWKIPARAQVVDGARDQLLAGPGLSMKQNRGVTSSKTLR